MVPLQPVGLALHHLFNFQGEKSSTPLAYTNKKLGLRDTIQILVFL